MNRIRTTRQVGLEHSKRGVSLIETIMVIVLLAAAALASSFLLNGQWVAKQNVSGVTNEIAETLIAAHNTAINNQAIVRVRRFRSDGIERLRIIENAGPYSPQKIRIIDLGPDAQVSGAPRQIRFNPSGTANRQLRWTIRQSRSRGRVEVSPADGQVTRRLP